MANALMTDDVACNALIGGVNRRESWLILGEQVSVVVRRRYIHVPSDNALIASYSW